MWERAAHVTLVSAAAASVLLGHVAAVDWADGSGTNLLDVQERTWSAAALAAVGSAAHAAAPAVHRTAAEAAAALEERMGPVVRAGADLGPVHAHLADLFGLTHCRVLAGSGDNPASYVGCCGRGHDLVVSLGTSDTLFGRTSGPPPAGSLGNFFCDPLGPGLLGLLCFRNGSLARQQLRDEVCEGSWATWDRALAETAPGNDGFAAAWNLVEETTPPGRAGTACVGPGGGLVPLAALPSRGHVVRSMVEGRFLSMRVRARELGLAPGPGGRLLATGGAAQNDALLQVLADVFGLPVFRSSATTSSAALGAALLAAASAYGNGVLDAGRGAFVEVCAPRLEHLPQYAHLERRLLLAEATLAGDQGD